MKLRWFSTASLAAANYGGPSRRIRGYRVVQHLSSLCPPLILAASSLVLSACSGAGSSASSPASPTSPPAGDLPGTAPAAMDAIQHVVFIIKENRTFDNYFGVF